MGRGGSKSVKQTGENLIGKGKPGPGRPKGIPNRTTALLKDAILLAAAEAGGDEGMVGYLKTQATQNPSAFLPLLGKVLPLQITGDPDGAAPILIELVDGIRAA